MKRFLVLLLGYYLNPAAFRVVIRYHLVSGRVITRRVYFRKMTSETRQELRHMRKWHLEGQYSDEPLDHPKALTFDFVGAVKPVWDQAVSVSTAHVAAVEFFSPLLDEPVAKNESEGAGF